MPAAGTTAGGALDGIEVVELGHHIAASYCTKLLADLGATVTKFEAPGGDPLRTLQPLDPTGSEPTSGLFHYLNASKLGACADLRDPRVASRMRELVADVDVVVENFSPGTMESFGLGPHELLAVNRGLVYARISNFGQTGPWRDRAASDLTLQAETGMMVRLGDGTSSTPVSISGRPSEYIAGTFAAAAAVAALIRKERCGVGAVVDLSLFEALLFTLSPVDALLEFLEGRGVAMPARQRVSPGFVPCEDGDVCISTLTAQNWEDLCSLIDQPEWRGRMRDVQLDGAPRAHFIDLLAKWTRPKTVAEVMTIMQAVRIAASTAADGRTLLTQPPFVARDFFVPQPGTTFVRPRAAWRLSATPAAIPRSAPALTDRGSDPQLMGRTRRKSGAVTGAGNDGLPLTGLRVVDFTCFLAGGNLSGSLAALGAEVIKVESPWRPDGYRFVMTYPEFGDHWWELSPLWQGQSLGKKSLAVDLGAAEGQEILRALIASADVVAENFTPRVVEAFGFGYEQVQELNPRAVMVRMPAFGLEGPWRDHVGFAYNIEQIGGLAQNGLEGQPLVQPAGIVDIVNGQHALVATLAALHHRDRTGDGQLVEVSQVEATACLTADQVIEYQLTGRRRERIGNRSHTCAPQGVYLSRDDRWIAVTVANDEQWRAICDELRAPGWCHDLNLEDRRERHAEIDELIAHWTRRYAATDIVARLQARQIPAGTMAEVSEMPHNPQLVARRYYRAAEHPFAGTLRCQRPVPLFSFGELAGGPPPMLGQHNEEVLRNLGFDSRQIDELARRGVIGEGLQA